MKNDKIVLAITYRCVSLEMAEKKAPMISPKLSKGPHKAAI